MNDRHSGFAVQSAAQGLALSVLVVGIFVTAMVSEVRAEDSLKPDLATRVRGLASLDDILVRCALDPCPQCSTLTKAAAKSALKTDAPYIEAATQSGLARSFILENMAAYRGRAEDALPDRDTLSVEEYRRVLHATSADIVGVQEAISDRVGILFGIGYSRVVWDRKDAEKFKIIARTDDDGDTQFIVRDGKSLTFPVALTGILAKIRSRAPHEDAVGMLTDALFPTAIFASAQLSGSDGSPLGAALGFGWQMVGDVHVLFGYNTSRVKTLRDDLRQDFEASDSQMLSLPRGETEESIHATESANGFVLVIAAPIALKSAFGS